MIEVCKKDTFSTHLNRMDNCEINRTKQRNDIFLREMEREMEQSKCTLDASNGLLSV